MNTFNDHVAAIRNVISKGAASKDLRITDRLIGHFLNIARASLIDKFKSPLNYQTLCLTIETSTMAEACPTCIDIPEACTNIGRSTIKLPNVIVENIVNPVIVRTIDGTQIGRMTATNNKHKRYSLAHTTLTLGWDIQNGDLIIFSDKPVPPLVLVDLLAANPEEITSLPECNNTTVTNCSSGTQEYPINPKALGALYDLTIKLLANAYNFGEDSRADARDLALKIINKTR